MAAISSKATLTRSNPPLVRSVAMTPSAKPREKREGDISDSFVSLSGVDRPPLPKRFLDLKKSLASGHEDKIIASWNRLLPRLRRENSIIAKEGSNVVPSLEFANLDEDIARLRSEIKKRGVAVVRNVIPEHEARAYKNDVEEYVRLNPSTRGKDLTSSFPFSLFIVI
jgi:hypothetical protein